MSNLLKVKVGGSDYLCKWKGSKLIYETDFSNFDLTTGIDTPLKGKSKTWTLNGNIQKVNRTIDGITYNAILLNNGAFMILYHDLIEKYPNGFTVECTTYKDSFSGLGCGMAINGLTNVFYNCYASNRGIGILKWEGDITTYNSFTYKHDNTYYSDYYNRTNVSQIIICGNTVIPNQNTNKAYVAGKKAVKISNVSSSTINNGLFRFYCDGNTGTTMCILNLKIYTYDKFEEME